MAKMHPPSLLAFQAEAVELARTSSKGMLRLERELGSSEQLRRGWQKHANVDARVACPRADNGERHSIATLCTLTTVLPPTTQVGVVLTISFLRLGGEPRTGISHASMQREAATSG